ncbi:membrane protein [Streptomyces viridochromogenes]|uniref:Membrane protein n=1 Tax=Streptomyces viridochromogenes TaxID=1938 RepID=A0A0J7YYU8_STRVR|nr:DUF4389 domain-containing protein [Streptomyces viridochromogenes]KMS68784.1 membrane protein [Streptomyces viridochromogenes]KOG17151.1 membrane protein [Streptomyces viridochromogenes]KOG20171.1 membrane protein [Streptomyces viridochromogenes]
MATGWDPRAATDPGGGEWLPVLDIPAAARQRRWTVLLRWLLLLPQFVVVCLLSVAAFFVTIVGWFAALFTGRLPDAVFRFLGSVLAYRTRVTASAMLLVDRYPPFSFSAPDHPVQIELRATPLNRLAVFFRLILMIPAAIINNLAQAGWFAICWVFWLIGIVLGRLPAPVFTATAAVARYQMRFTAYVTMLTPAYPKRLFGDEPPPPDPARSGTRPLLLDTTAKVLVVLFLLLGVACHVVSGTVDYDDNGQDGEDVMAPAAVPAR